jgi:hypothetical protein
MMPRTKKPSQRRERAPRDDRQVHLAVVPYQEHCTRLGVGLKSKSGTGVLAPDEARAIAREEVIQGSEESIIRQLNQVADFIDTPPADFDPPGKVETHPAVLTGTAALKLWVESWIPCFQAAYHLTKARWYPERIVIAAYPSSESMDDGPTALYLNDFTEFRAEIRQLLPDLNAFSGSLR